jgi:hypothetical protein
LLIQVADEEWNWKFMHACISAPPLDDSSLRRRKELPIVIFEISKAVLPDQIETDIMLKMYSALSRAVWIHRFGFVAVEKRFGPRVEDTGTGM